VSKMTDVDYKHTLASWEPWKAMSTALIAGVIVASTMAGFSMWLGPRLLAHFAVAMPQCY
jgi:hypothetical protein